MTVQQYREIKFREESLAKIDRINEVIGKYDQKLTARQVYYQFVSRGWLRNDQRSYKTLTNLLTDARYAGLVDWEAIEDRGREPNLPLEFNSIQERVDAALRNFRLPRWKGQPHYVELWVEKQALAGVLAPLAHEFHVPLMVNKGYSSASAMKEAADRFIAGCTHRHGNAADDVGDEDTDGDEDGFVAIDWYRQPILFYLGDHDPSGEDMVRDIRTRLMEFGVKGIQVDKLALTMEQIRRFRPPPNPAKVSDSRAAAYIKKYGASSWELDALPPNELTRLVRNSIGCVTDAKKMLAVIAKEDADRESLRAPVKNL